MKDPSVSSQVRAPVLVSAGSIPSPGQRPLASSKSNGLFRAISSYFDPQGPVASINPKAPGIRTAISAHPLLFGCLFVLAGYRQKLPFSNLGELFAGLVGVLALIFLAQLALACVFRHPCKPGILTTLGVIFFCFFDDWKSRCEGWFLGTYWSQFARAAWQIPLMGIVFLGLCALVIRSGKNLFPLRRYLNLVGALTVAGTVGQVVFARHPMPEIPISPQARLPMATGQNPPDIFYILTDAYTSSESLQKFWGYDNSSFNHFLTAQGFHIVKDAHGNATATPRSLSTCLNMNYTQAPVDLSMTAVSDYYCRIIADAEAPSRLKASGYQITNLSIFATAGEPGFYSFARMSSPTLGEVLFYKSAAGYLNMYRMNLGFGDINLKIFSLLPEIAAARTDKPRFVYAHLMMPHQPFLFDRNGNRIRRGISQSDRGKDLYLGQLIYENSLLTNAISGILKNSKIPPIIILQGDHGYRFLTDAHREEEAATILNALYLPGSKDDWFYPGMTPVNTFRLIFNHYFGGHYPYLPDQSPKTLSRFLSTSPEE
jgi:hypothetical protein